jgi:hypothetical protein
MFEPERVVDANITSIPLGPRGFVRPHVLGDMSCLRTAALTYYVYLFNRLCVNTAWSSLELK